LHWRFKRYVRVRWKTVGVFRGVAGRSVQRTGVPRVARQGGSLAEEGIERAVQCCAVGVVATGRWRSAAGLLVEPSVGAVIDGPTNVRLGVGGGSRLPSHRKPHRLTR
jgi:hypothetical protein